MMATRTRNATQTRAAILAAAKATFARVGYERATIRAVARAAKVDPALVMRYYGSKADLFAHAADLDLRLPDLAGLSPEEIAHALVDRFFEVWEDDDTFLALLRATTSSETAAKTMRAVFAEQAAPALAAGAIDHPRERAALAGTQVLGFAFSRYIIKVPSTSQMTRAEVRAWLGPALTHHLVGPAPAAAATNQEERA